MTPQIRYTDFKTLVDTHREKVRNICFRYVNNVDDADDLAQEVFIQVHESLKYFREESEFSTWIYRIAVNKSLDFIRKQKRRKRFAQLLSFGSANVGDEMHPIADGDPHRELEEKELNLILSKAIDGLPEGQKTAIILSKHQGFSNKEIASIMDVSLPAVEAMIHRAKQNLHKKLYRYFKARI